jgi:hypothetical protein
MAASFFGYKNHVNADAKHKLIRHYAVADAAVHDSQELDGLLDEATLVRRQRLSVGRDRGQTQGQWLQQLDSSTRVVATIRYLWRKCERTTPRADTRSQCVRIAAERAGRSDRANDRHGAGARQDRLAEPGLQIRRLANFRDKTALLAISPEGSRLTMKMESISH